MPYKDSILSSNLPKFASQTGDSQSLKRYLIINFFELFSIPISYYIAGNPRFGRIKAIGMFNVCLACILLAI